PAGQPGKQWGIHGDDGVGLEPESMVGAEPARGTGPLASPASNPKALGIALGVQEVCQCFCASAVPDHPHRPQADLSAPGLESVPADLLPVGRRVALLTRATLKSESGCSDPPRHQVQTCGKESEPCQRQDGNNAGCSSPSRTETVRRSPRRSGYPGSHTIFACLRTSLVSEPCVLITAMIDTSSPEEFRAINRCGTCL